jgi:hypothetical protein
MYKYKKGVQRLQTGDENINYPDLASTHYIHILKYHTEPHKYTYIYNYYILNKSF